MHPITRRELLRLLAGGAIAYGATRWLGCNGPVAPEGPTTLPSSAAPALPTSTATRSLPTTAATTTRSAAATSAPSPTATAPQAQPPPTVQLPDIAVLRGNDPAEITRRAVAALGGMERFVRPGQTVIVKPNICHAPAGVEYGTTTHPAVVGALVAMALAAGARKVQVMDGPFASRPDEAYARSGIRDEVVAAGGEMVVMSAFAFGDTAIPAGRNIRSWSVYKPALEADVLIDVPVAKHHGSAGLSLAMKNLMGLLEPNGRGLFHGKLHQNIADLTTLFRPQLTVVDAVRTLMAHGPTGGNLADVRQRNTVIASPDIVAADAYAATLFDKQPQDIGYIAIGADMGLGSADLKALRIQELAL